MTINLTPELERALAEVARRRGTTPEMLALDYLREHLLPAADTDEENPEAGTLYDLLAGHIGVLASSETFPAGRALSKEPGGAPFTGRPRAVQ